MLDSPIHRLRETFNRYSDRIVHPKVLWLGKSWSTFTVCGCLGFVPVLLLATLFVYRLSLSVWVVIGIISVAVLTLLALALVTKIITGEEQLIYYHQQIAILSVTALLLWWCRQPILPYLDATILGIGVFLASGRIGCLMVGCCHGRPSQWGVCYRKEHAAAGFPPYYVGVRLFPVQAIESLWVSGIVLVGSSFILSGRSAGTALAWYVVAYGIGRFCFEFKRGDTERPYHWDFSQPQWMSLLLMCVVAWMEVAGVLSLHPWHIGAAGCLAVTMAAVTLRRRCQQTSTHRLLRPRHVKEIAEALQLISAPATEPRAIGNWSLKPERNRIGARIRTCCTSLGIRMSESKIRIATGYISHYTLSLRNGGMTEEIAMKLGRIILQLKRMDGSGEFVKGDKDTFHLLVHPVPEEKSVSR